MPDQAESIIGDVEGVETLIVAARAGLDVAGPLLDRIRRAAGTGDGGGEVEWLEGLVAELTSKITELSGENDEADRLVGTLRAAISGLSDELAWALAEIERLQAIIGGPPPEGRQFRSWAVPKRKEPERTPTPDEIEHVDGGNVYGAGTGKTINVRDDREAVQAVNASSPGDLITVTRPIRQLNLRGRKWGIGPSSDGAAMDNGTETRPIIAICRGEGIVSDPSLGNEKAGIEVANVDHVWLVGMRTNGNQFSARFANVSGTQANPVRVAHVNLQGAGHANLAIAGWWQPVSRSGGTPPPGAANAWGFSQHVLVEASEISDAGRAEARFGENVYLGSGSHPGLSQARDVTLRHLDLHHCRSDHVDIKPGCRRVRVLDSELHDGTFVAGAAIQVLYLGPGQLPSTIDYDPEIVLDSLRIWNGNQPSFSQPGSSRCAVQASMPGVQFTNSLVWGFPPDGIAFRARSEAVAAQSRVAGERWLVANNTFWTALGIENAGSGSLVPFPADWFETANNIRPVGAGRGPAPSDYQFGVGEFVNPAGVPAPTVPHAANGGFGPGSAFVPKPGRAGTSIKSLGFWREEDATGRPLPSPVSPGALQP